MKGMIERLKDAGLTGNEAKVYLELLRRGEANGNVLAKKTVLDRSLTYTVLNNLVDKGMVSYLIKDRKRLFKPSDPENLLVPIKEQEDFINDLIPSLKAIKPKKTEKSNFMIYEGKEGMKVLFEKMMAVKKEVLFFGGTGKSFDLLQYEIFHIIKRFKTSGMKLRGIISYSNRNHEYVGIEGAEIAYLKDVNSNATTCIFGDTVSVHVLLEEEKPIVMIMENKEIANGYRAYFDFMFKNAEMASKSQ